jgi:signal transduction histidine kinase
MARMIRDLLDLAGSRDGRLPLVPSDADLHALTRQVIDELCLSYPECPVDHLPHGDGAGRWDADRVAQAVGNLVANAMQHGPPGGRTRVRSTGTRDHVEIEVHNEGPPIDPAVRERLFEPYQRGAASGGASEQGVGLGLYITHRVVDAHGGTIGVTSTAEDGTTFRVRLPRWTSET